GLVTIANFTDLPGVDLDLLLDAKSGTNGSLTNGSMTLTSAGADFLPSYVGKTIAIGGVGTFTIPAGVSSRAIRPDRASAATATNLKYAINWVNLATLISTAEVTVANLAATAASDVRALVNNGITTLETLADYHLLTAAASFIDLPAVDLKTLLDDGVVT